MKKFLALLLVLCLPGCVFAETYGLSVSFSADEELLAWYVKQALQADPGAGAYGDEQIAAMISLIDGLGVELAVQEDAMTLDMQLAGSSMLDLTMHMEGEDALLTSTLLPGYALKAEQTASGANEQILSELMEGADWNAISDSITAAIGQWAGDIEPTVSSGVYAGDAYEGGTECTTWMLSDRDISALVSSLATSELRAALIPMLNALELDGGDLFAQFDALNGRIADEDMYAYVLRIVRNDAGEFVGASLTVMEETVQVATVSFGMNDKTAKLVIGFGLAEQNYWWEMSAKQSQLRNITYISGQSREWIADKSEGFAYVSATNAPVSEYAWRSTVTKSGNRYLWDGNVSVGDDVRYEYLLSFSGSYAPGTGALSCSISLGDAPYEPLTMKISIGPVAEIAPPDASSLQICSLNDPADAQLSESLLKQLAAGFLARMLKHTPIDMLLDMVDILP